MREWRDIATAPEGVVIETKIDDKRGASDAQTVERDGAFWWLPDGSMYVYYVPTHWRPVDRASA